MLANRVRVGAVAAWLGVIALSLNALVPIHLAFDLAEALAPGHHEAAATDHDFVRCLLTLVIGHHDDDADQPRGHKNHHPDCAVCSAIGTLAGFAPAAATAQLAMPVVAYVRALPPTDGGVLHSAPFTAYHSRAPPFA
jgi:Protein of unknown function (DUF2946)